MALTTTQITQITDSLAKGCDDFNTAFILNTNTNTPLYSTIVTGVSGTGASQTLGRVLNFLELASEVNMLGKMQAVAATVTSYIASIRSLAGYYQTLYPVLDALDLSISGGLNAFLTTNSLQVSAHVATAFNNYQNVAVAAGFRSAGNIPTAIAVPNYFPYAVVDDMWDMTASGATTFSANLVGANTSTAVSGGGSAQLYIYKVNAGNAAGGATFTITYTNALGGSSQATYSTVSGTPTASGSLAAGFSISGAIVQAVTAVTATGMTSGEQYRLGCKLLRSPAY